MRRCRIFGVLAGMVLFALPGCSAEVSDAGAAGPDPLEVDRADVDLVIRGARILDGLGNPAVEGDIVVDHGLIVTLGPASGGAYRGAREIDADGRYVTPGFVDPHSHGDPLQTPEFENFLAMGVTTITLGQDGSSPAVDNLGAWLEEVEARGIGPNLAMFVGHGTLRDQAGIGLEPEPSVTQMQAMLERLERALDNAFGLSTGLEYNPGLHAGEAELLALAEVVGARDRLIMSHMRNEDDDQLAGALAELVAQGVFARVHVSHLKSVYGKGAARGEEILQLLAAARADGVAISADIYPYNASYAGVSLLFPVWAKTAAQFAQARADRYDELAGYLRDRVNARNGPEATLFGTEPFVGQTLSDLAVRFELPFEQVLIDVIGPQGGHAAYFVMNDELQSTLLTDPGLAICSDGSPTGFHPRGHGTFARIIEEYVVARGTLSLPEAVRKMTSLPAAIIGLPDRGVLAPGKAADLLVFDPRAVRANASYVDPLQLADGFDIVIVNGHIARDQGQLATTLSGTTLHPRQ